MIRKVTVRRIDGSLVFAQSFPDLLGADYGRMIMWQSLSPDEFRIYVN